MNSTGASNGGFLAFLRVSEEASVSFFLRSESVMGCFTKLVSATIKLSFVFWGMSVSGLAKRDIVFLLKDEESFFIAFREISGKRRKTMNKLIIPHLSR